MNTVTTTTLLYYYNNYLTMTTFELLPEDLQGHISSILNFTDVLELQQTSTYLKHVKQHIQHMFINFEDYYHKRLSSFNVAKLCIFITKNLKSLQLYCRELSGAEVMCIVLHLPQTLQTLTFADCDITYDTIKVAAQYLPKTLISLNISFNKLSSDVHLLNMLQQSRLQILNLAGCGIDEQLTDLQLPTTLQKLDLSCNEFDAPTLLKIADRLPISLRTLDISECYIGGEHWKNKQLPVIKKLHPNLDIIND